MSAPYCTPLEAGKQSEAAAVGRRIGRLLDSLGAVNTWVCQGDLTRHCDRIGDCLRRRLRAEGWRITVNAFDCWQVLPPKRKARR